MPGLVLARPPALHAATPLLDLARGRAIADLEALKQPNARIAGRSSP